MERGSGWRQANRAPTDAAYAADPTDPARQGAPHPGRRGGPDRDLDGVLPGRAGRGGRRPALRHATCGRASPGPHLKLPFGIETVTKVPGAAPAQDGVRLPHRAGGQATVYASAAARRARGESLMLTGDLNVAVVEWIVQYRIKDPKAYLFHVRDVPRDLPLHVGGRRCGRWWATTASTR